MIEHPLHGFTGPDTPPADVFDRCVRCGLCLPTCPTYVETLVETSGPRGRIALIKAVSEDRLDLTSPGFVHQMSECLDCRACEAVCPSGVAYGELLEPARTQIVRATATTRSPRERFARAVLLGWLFSSLANLRTVAGVLDPPDPGLEFVCKALVALLQHCDNQGRLGREVCVQRRFGQSGGLCDGVDAS